LLDNTKLAEISLLTEKKSRNKIIINIHVKSAMMVLKRHGNL